MPPLFVVFILLSDSLSSPHYLWLAVCGHLIPGLTLPLPRLFSVLYSSRPLILVEYTNEPSCCNTPSKHKDVRIARKLGAFEPELNRSGRPGCTACLLPGRCSVLSSLDVSMGAKIRHFHNEWFLFSCGKAPVGTPPVARPVPGSMG